MDRFYLSPEDWDRQLLVGDEAHHCRRVMRKKIGDQIEVFDGFGKSALGMIRELTAREVALEFSSEETSSALAPDLTLAVGIPKGKTFDLIIQKSVELGVQRIVPLLTQQGNIRLSAKERAAKQDKWQRVALEACKQCGQNYLPHIAEATELCDWEPEEGSARFVAALEPDRRPLRSYLREGERPSKVVMAIGPEGDLTSEEYDYLRQLGFQAITLGPLILRTETAAFAMVSGVRYEFLSESGLP